MNAESQKTTNKHVKYKKILIKKKTNKITLNTTQ